MSAPTVVVVGDPDSASRQLWVRIEHDGTVSIGIAAYDHASITLSRPELLAVLAELVEARNLTKKVSA